MTATATKSRTRKPQPRKVNISSPVNGGYAIRMTVGEGDKAKHFGYFVQRIPADFGLGFHFEKFATEQVEGEPSEYDVNIDLQRGCHSCTCKGNTYCRHCKHVESVLALIQSGKIDVPQQAAPKPEAKLAAKQPWCEHCGDNPNVWCEHCTL